MVEVTIDRDNEIVRTAIKGNSAIVAAEAMTAAVALLNALSTVTGDDEEARDLLITSIESNETLQTLRDAMEEEQ